MSDYAVVLVHLLYGVENGNEISVKKAEFDEELYSSWTTQDSCFTWVVMMISHHFQETGPAVLAVIYGNMQFWGKIH